MKLLTRFRNYLLGTNAEDEEYYEEDSYEEEYDEEPQYYRREREREREREPVASPPASRRSRSESNVLNMPTSYTNPRPQITICHPVSVDDATDICGYLKTDVICVVNLEGVERLTAQRIADFLGGSCFALAGEIQKVNNEIFLIAPASVGISNELREELRESGLVLPWLSNSLR